MKKLYSLFYFVIVFLLIGKNTKTLGQSPSTNYFRSATSGAWESPNVWEVSADGVNNWIPASTTPNSSANTITIRSTHNVSITNSVAVDEVVIAGGATLELATGQSLTLTVSDGPGSDIIVQNGGIFKHNIASSSSLPMFSGSAAIEIQQSGILEVANNNGLPSNYANTASATSSHVVFNDGSIFNWNNSVSPADGIAYFPASTAIPVFRVSQPVTIGGTTSTTINGLLEANASVSFQGNGSKTFRNGIIGTGKVGVTALNGGQFIINGATAQLGGQGVLELNNNGLLISAGTIMSLSSDKTVNNYFNGTSTSTGTISNAGTLIAGDYIISGTGKMQIDGSLTTTNVNGLSGGANTTFATGFALQSLGSTSVIEYKGNANQLVTPLAYNNLIISGGGVKTAAQGADVSVSGSLNISAGSTFALNGTNNLKLNGGGTLNIYANAVFDNGGESQVSGGGGPIVNIYGTFVTKDAQGLSGTGTAIPGATVNIFDGSTIEYGGTADQIVTPRNDYKNLTFSGSGIKTLPTCRPIGTVTIKDNAIADASNKTFGDTSATNLVMTGGRFRVGGTGTKPDILGTYTLTGGVIEFINSGATKQTIRSTPVYLNIEVKGTNVTNSVSSTKIANGGSFTIKTGGSYDNNSDKIDGTLQGIESFVMEAGSIFKTGVKGGFSGNDTSALQNIDKITIDPKSTIIYSRMGNQTLTPLAGAYPSLLLKGSGTKTLAAGNLTLSSAADSIVIDPLVVLKVSQGAKIDFKNRPIFIHSNSGGSGIIGEISSGAAALLNATNVTVERFIPARRSFRFLSPPVAATGTIKSNWMEGVTNPDVTTRLNPNPGYGTNITGKDGSTNGFDPTKTNNPSLFTFNVSTQKWEAITNTNAAISFGSGYRLMVRGDRSVDMTQYDNNPSPTNTILRTRGSLYAGSFSPALSTVYNGYTFIGNPYMSPVDFLKMIQMNSSFQVTGTANNIKPEYTTWDPNLSRRGSYVTFNAATGKSNSASQISQDIQPGQAFFVQTVGQNPKVQFDEAYKSTGQTKVFRDPSLRTQISVQLLLNLDEGIHNTADGVVALFDSSFSKSLGNEDSYKLPNPDESIAIDRDGRALSIEGRQGITANDTIPLKIWQFRQKDYYLKIGGEHFLPEIAAFLIDKYLKKENPLDLSTVTLLPFSVDTTIPASFVKDRFSIIFKAGQMLPVTLTDIKANQKDEGVLVEWTTQSELNVKNYEVEKSTDGHHFVLVQTIPAKSLNAISANYLFLDENPNPKKNFYRIKILEKSGEVKYSKVVNVVILSIDKQKISVSPNPVTGNVIELRLNNIEKGNYIVHLYNSLGQSIYTTTLKHTFQASYYIKPGLAIPKGVYRITLSNGDKNINKTLIFE